jgi:predicted DNA-binding transcriptional regulator AlpA
LPVTCRQFDASGHRRRQLPGKRQRHAATEEVVVVSPEELRELPAVVDLPTAARVLGIGRTVAYRLVRSGQWPTPVLRVGRLLRVPTAPLLELVGASAAASS